MILFLLLVGFLVGGTSAALAFAAGSGFAGALLAYSLYGAVGMVIAALFLRIAPMLQLSPGFFAAARAEQR